MCYPENAGKPKGPGMAGTGLVARKVVVDALPYLDQGYEAPGMWEAAAALEETQILTY